MKFRKILLVSLSLLTVFCSAQLFSAGKQGKKPDSYTFAFVGGRSLKDVAIYRKQWQLPLPPAISKQAIEAKFPFIGRGGIDDTRPIGMFFVWGENINPRKGQGAIFMLPVKKGFGSLEPFKARGAQTLSGHDDTILLNGFPFRRTKGYLMMGGTADAIVSFDPEKIAESFEEKNALILANLDLNNIRKNSPETLDTYSRLFMMAQSEKDNNNPVISFFKDAIVNKLKTVKAELSDKDGELKLSVRISPSPGEMKEAVFPVRPSNALFSASLSYPPEDINKIVDTFVEAEKKDISENRWDSEIDKVNKEKIRIFLKVIFKELFKDVNGLAFSFEGINDGPLYCLQISLSLDKESKFIDRIKKIVKASKEIAKFENEEKILELSKFKTESNVEVDRITAFDNNSKVAYFDFIQKKNNVLISVQAAPGKSAISRLLNSKMVKQKSLSAKFDLYNFLKYFSMSEDTPFGKYPQSDLDAILKAAKGKNIELGCDFKKDEIEAELSLDKDLIALFIKMATAPQSSGNINKKKALLGKLDNALKNYPDSFLLLVEKIDLFYDTKEYGKAEKTIDKLLSFYPKNHKYIAKKSIELYRRNDIEKASDAMESYVKKIYEDPASSLECEYSALIIYNADNDKKLADLKKKLSDYLASKKDKSYWEKKFTGCVLGSVSAEELKRLAMSYDDEQRNSALKEAYFAIAANSILKGNKAEAEKAFEKCVSVDDDDTFETMISEVYLSRKQKKLSSRK